MKKKTVRKEKPGKKSRPAPPAKNKVVAGKKLKTGGVKLTDKKPALASPNTKTNSSFPIVCIGGSAGGMEAFSKLLEHLPENLGMAYVYIQHLSPDHKSFLPQILQRKTHMPVLQAKDNMRLQKDHVYIIPASFNISVSNGKLKLQKLLKEQGHYAIDKFMISLAPQYQQNAIGIILSGTGTDGTLGLKAIKADGGISFAQDNTAGYPGMPHHAVGMGYVDFVMPPDKIAKELASFIQHPYAITTPNDYMLENKSELRKIHLFMYNKRGVDFSYYKQTTIQRRILRRMALNKIKDISDYVQILKDNKTEVDALYQDLLITVTDFFRDPALYQALSTKILPNLVKNRKPNDPLRIWIPGCATGEEAISFAIVVLEYLGEKAISTQIQIFATDLNDKAIEHARNGIYLKTAVQNISQQRLRKFFVKTDGHYQVVKSIRDMCIFAPHNLLKDPPFSRMDVISCQNVLIYIESVPQNKIMHSFHYALKSTGYLLLGKSETIGNSFDLFLQPSKHHKVYTKRLVNTTLKLDFSPRFHTSVYELDDDDTTAAPNHTREPDLEKETDKLLLSRYVPASVLVNKDLEILRFRGSTSRYIEPASGKASLHLLKMIKEELSFELRTALHHAKKDGKPSKKEGIVMGVNGVSVEVGIEVLPMKTNGKDVFYLIIFKETKVPVPEENAQPSLTKNKQVTEKRITNLESQLKESRDSIRIMTEDFEATREELQSANEEVLSSNEELQSINEELETSKEELQSTNEELTTINEELQLRNNELKESGEYALAIGEMMHESFVMLTSDLKIRNANHGFYRNFQLTPDEINNMNLFEIGNRQWDIPELRQQLKIIQTKDILYSTFEVTVEFAHIGKKNLLFNVHKFSIKEGTGFRIMLAIQDLTDWKQMETSLRYNEERFRLLIQNASDIITVFSADGTIRYESPAIENVLGFKPEENIGKNINRDSHVHPDDRHIISGLLKMVIAHPRENINGEFRFRHADGSYRIIDGIFRNFLDDEKINGIIGTYRDITERKSLEIHKEEFIGIASHELKTPVTSIKAYTQILEAAFLKANDHKSAGLLTKMNRQVDRLTTLITDLLDYTRLEGGKLKFRKEKYNLNDLILEVTEEMQRTTTQHSIVKKMGKPVKLMGDRLRTGQVLTNLLNNAIKYSPHANKIVVSTKSDSGIVTVCVQDFGIGIDEYLQEKVFDRYFRVSKPTFNSISGLGLGLYIAAEFIKRQGGNIWVKSKQGKGSTFCFSLPLNNE